MPRSIKAYLSDIVECCEAVENALKGVNLETYRGSRLIRSSVERELTIIGEAVNCLVRLNPKLAESITHARLIVGFRNRLTHEYVAIDDETVLRIAEHDTPILKSECTALLDSISQVDEAD